MPPSTPTTINSIPSSPNQPPTPTPTIVSGQTQVQVLSSNNMSTNETNPLQQKPVGTGEFQIILKKSSSSLLSSANNFE